jgi:hypothetical protein
MKIEKKKQKKCNAVAFNFQILDFFNIEKNMAMYLNKTK